MSLTGNTKQPAPERRSEDRRKAQGQPLPFPDRRVGERRQGQDRRSIPRSG